MYHHQHPEANPQYEIVFHSHGRHFKLKLKRDTESVFHRNLIIEDTDGRPVSVNLDHLVTGHLEGQPNSLVFGSVRDGIFTGKMHATLPEEDTFYVERSEKYFTTDRPVDIYLLDKTHVNATHSAKHNLYHIAESMALGHHTTPAKPLPELPFHSVIYSSKHVIDPHKSKRSPVGKWPPFICQTVDNISS